ncbi:MAG: DUF1156 domain-containing protein [Deltaproteobacteria bacterium]|nr:DUF1156 domain-containing protein [Deltaproteobacteria bacterium]
MTGNDKRLIEDYLPIEAISKEASREKSVRKGHISTLHLWARRPLVACRAAVYGALVPASRFAPKNGPEEKRASLTRANAAKFVDRLCKYPGDRSTIAEAQRHILEAHAERLTTELAEGKVGGRRPAWADEFKFDGERVTVEDITAGRAPRPRVLDMFAGGGAIPLEALRLGCEAYAMDLNPVAYIIELCTLVYPQKYGKPDPNARGMTGPKNGKGETTWDGLANEVRYWGNWVLKKAKAEIGDLYPVIPDPEFKGKRKEDQTDWLKKQDSDDAPQGYLMPVAYLWTRTVRCKNPACGAIVPLVRQTWLCKKKGRYAAMKLVKLKNQKRVRFEVVEARSERELGFDPAGFSSAGNAACPFCGAVNDNDYVKAEGIGQRLGRQLMAVAASRRGDQGKIYISADDVLAHIPDEVLIAKRLSELSQVSGITVPDEPTPDHVVGGGGNCQPYGFHTWSSLFTARQLLSLLTFCISIRRAHKEAVNLGIEADRAKALSVFLAALLDRLADFNSSLCLFNYTGGRGVVHTFGRQALPMVWDFAETNVFNPEGASWISGIEDLPAGLRDADSSIAAQVMRGSAASTEWPVDHFDAVITDPPYYDNIGYAVLADFFYVWLKRSIGDLFPEHFSSVLSPKKAEAVADPALHSGNKQKARNFYETMMLEAFHRASRSLKNSGEFVVVYAHKTTLGWATLVDALRQSGMTVVEAWPLDTEKSGRLMAQETAALASSIFLVARKRAGTGTANYEENVRAELVETVRERVETLWDMGVAGADLVIASVGAGLRPFTRFGRVEYANGEEVPAGRFLGEVETVVLETILARLSKEVGSKGGYSLAGLDAATRFYILWRYTYRGAELDAGEAIIFANGAHVELDGSGGLSVGGRALVEKKKGKYRLLDYTERGDDDKLGLPDDNGRSASLVDALHRTLWLMENRPAQLAKFLQDAQPDREQMRLVAQALAGPALKGGELADVSPSDEMAALAKLTANWRSVIEDRMLPLFR